MKSELSYAKMIELEPLEKKDIELAQDEFLDDLYVERGGKSSISMWTEKKTLRGRTIHLQNLNEKYRIAVLLWIRKVLGE